MTVAIDFANHRLVEQHKEWIDALSEERALFSDCMIGILDILNIHFSIVDYFLENSKGEKAIGDIGPIDKERLSSAVARQSGENAGYPKWNTDYEKCATLFYGLIKNHPFPNCNNRTALITALYYLAKLNLTPTACHKELEIITKIIASNEIRDRKAFKPYTTFEDGEIRFLAEYFQKNTGPIGEKYYAMTYRELNKLLPDFGYCLNHPHGNSIDVTRIEKRSSLFGLPRKRNIHTKVGVIGFAGWTRAVSNKNMRLLREYTGLTEKDGLDSQVAYKGVPPLSSLLNTYQGVLQLLAEK